MKQTQSTHSPWSNGCIGKALNYNAASPPAGSDGKIKIPEVVFRE